MAVKKRSCTHAATTLIFIFQCFCMGPSPSHSINSTTQGQNLTDGEILVSAGGRFALGFFTPSAKYSYYDWTSSSRYLGIWFRDGTDQINPVWVANRETPIPDMSGVLTIDADGKLKIMYGHRNSSIIIVSNTIINGRATTTATLLDSGNFVLTTGEVVLWQSFDYPTDTLLPGMKLGINLKTGQNWSLTSWLSDQIPASGAFTLQLDHHNDTNQLIISRRGEVYWRSGIWNRSNFNNIHDELWTNSLNFSFVSNKDEKYFSISSTKMNNDSSSVIMVTDSRGDVITNHGGEYLITCQSSSDRSFSHGCVGHKPLVCRSDLDDQQFEQRTYGEMLGDNILDIEDPSLGISDCYTKCWSNCSCVAYANSNYNGTGCILWGTGSMFNRFGDTQLFVLPSLLSHQHGNNNHRSKKVCLSFQPIKSADFLTQSHRVTRKLTDVAWAKNSRFCPSGYTTDLTDLPFAVVYPE